MNFKTHNNKAINARGTSLQGEINCAYKTLKKVFGNPTTGDGYKVDAEWEIEGTDGSYAGVVATIYNYNNGKNYNGANGLAKTKITDWHVGGNSEKSVELIKAILGL